MIKLFNKVAVFTDLHYGLKSNSITHNIDCDNFIQWFITTAKEHNCDVGICMGDYHHNRNSLNIETMNHSIYSLEQLGKAFSQFFFILGNHDLYFKDKRTIHSIEFGKFIKGITLITEPTKIDSVLFYPWLIGTEWKKIQKLSGEYIFGHFELPNFFMNSMVKMPDTNEIKLEHFSHFNKVFSGHFHMRQAYKNIHYIGNCFPHNFSDANDFERGMMILEWNKEPVFITWPNQPTYITTNLSTLVDNHSDILSERQYVNVTIDIDVNFEEATYLKEFFINEYKLRELSLSSKRSSINDDNSIDVTLCKSVDEMVATQITTINSDKFKTNKLLEIYNTL